MQTFGRTDTEGYARIVFIVFAVIAACLGTISLLFLQRLNILPVYLLPLLCFCVCYENTLLSLGGQISGYSKVAYAGNVFHSLEIPLFVIILHETSLRLYQSRSFQFCCIRFDQNNGRTKNYAAVGLLWSVRIIAIGLFIMNIFADFAAVPSSADCRNAGIGGYVSFVQDPNCTTLILSLLPPMFLSFISITIGMILVRYGYNLTLRLHNSRRWRIILICALAQTISQIFSVTVYSVTSNAGEIALLFGVTVLVFLVQEDFSLAGSFADFLRSSNVAFLDSDNAAVELRPVAPPDLNIVV